MTAYRIFSLTDSDVCRLHDKLPGNIEKYERAEGPKCARRWLMAGMLPRMDPKQAMRRQNRAKLIPSRTIRTSASTTCLPADLSSKEDGKGVSSVACVTQCDEEQGQVSDEPKRVLSATCMNESTILAPFPARTCGFTTPSHTPRYPSMLMVHKSRPSMTSVGSTGIPSILRTPSKRRQNITLSIRNTYALSGMCVSGFEAGGITAECWG